MIKKFRPRAVSASVSIPSRMVPMLFVLLLCIVLPSAPHCSSVIATSDRSLKRRAQRLAQQGEKRLEDIAEAIDEAEIAQHKNTLGATYERALNEVVSAHSPQNTLGNEPIPTIRQHIPLTFHQCVHHAQRWLRLFPDASGVRLGGNFHNLDNKRIKRSPFTAMLNENPLAQRGSNASTEQEPASPCGPNRNCSASRNPCGLHYTPYEEMFSGVDRIILIGDSTILRLYKFFEQVRESSYRQKVADLPIPHIIATMTMSSGRKLPVHFFRLLYSSMAPAVIHEAFKFATIQSLLLVSLGPHDTSWLIYDRLTFLSMHVMPGMSLAKEVDRRTGKKYKQSDVLRNNLMRAKAYWLKHIAITADALGKELMDFEDAQRSLAAREGRILVPGEPLRPIVVFREQLLPKCSDPKYANRPHTRCVSMLKPHLVPFMRDYLRAMLITVNIPVIGLDALSGRAGLPCYLMDAGHLPRPCKTIELEMASYTFRMGRRLRIVQGYTRSTNGTSSPYGSPPSLHTLLNADGGISWQHLSRRVTHLRPFGFVHPNEFVRSNPIYSTPPLIIPPPEVYSQAEWQLFRKFDDPAAIERAVMMRGAPIIPGAFRKDTEGDNETIDRLMDAAMKDAEAEAAKEGTSEQLEEGSTPTSSNTGSTGSSPTLRAAESSVDLTGQEVVAALNAVNDNTTVEDIENIMGESTYGKHGVPMSHRLGTATLISVLALTVVAFLLWRSVE